ncbi:MAG: TonB-dependent receptor domain-containing protein [Bryobacteraceae bacterium]
MRARSLLWAGLIALGCTIGLFAGQGSRGTILGRVSDPTEAVVAGARVDATNTATGVHSSSTSSASGDYLLPYLIPGTYDVLVEAQGFKSYKRLGILVRESDRVTVDVPLQIGGSSQTVAVTGASPQLDTSTASMGQVMDRRAIEDLPTKDGMPLVLATLVPGVTFTPQTAGYVRPFDTASPSTMSVDGTRPGSNEFLIDGAPDLQGQQIAYSPAQSIVNEFKVQTATFDAGWGFNVGAAINFTTKSGTNSPHGTLSYMMLNPVFNADKYFRLAAGKPQLRTHHLDSSFTGPIYIPKVYDGRNKTFFTLGYEWGYWFDPTPYYVGSVPTAAQKNGDFSNLLRISPAYQIYDPYSTTPAGNGLFRRTPLPNNVIPPSQLNPVALQMSKLFDPPNQPGTIDGTNNYVMPRNMQDTYYNQLTRIDHNVSDKQRLYGRYNVTKLVRPENVSNNLADGDNFYRYNHGAAIDHVYIASPRFVVDSRYSFMRFTTGYIPIQEGWDLASLGFSPTFINQLKGLDPRALKLPNLTFANYFQQTPIGGANNHNQQIYNTHEAAVNITNTFGAHTLRSGLTYRSYLENAFNLGASSGAFTFNSTFTGGPLSTSSASPIGQDFASFLYGLPASGNLPINDSFAEKQSYWALYLQDDWKLNSKLTISLGLRYELPSSLTERYNRSVGTFDPTAVLPISSQVQQKYAQNPIPQVPQLNVNGGLTFPGVGGASRDLWDRSIKNFMPRVGFAYSLTPKTVLRAGFGIYYQPLGITFVNVDQTGFNASTAFVPTINNGQTYTATLTNPFPNGLNRALGASAGPSTFLGQNITFFDTRLRNPYMQRWQFAIQRQLPGDTVFEISYVGNRGTRLLTTQDFNAIPAPYLSTSPVRDQTRINALNSQVANPFYPLLPGTNLASTTVAVSQLLRPNPQFSGITATTNAGFSWYHALQSRVEKRLSHGLVGQYSFTWSKTMEAISYLNPTDLAPAKVISDQDRPFRSALSLAYELPFGPGRQFGNSLNGVLGKFVGGWQLNGVYTNQSGPPLGFGNAILTCGLNQVTLPGDQRSINMWFNASCFNRTSSQQLASNIQTLSTRFTGIRGPRINNLDLSLIKNMHVTERLRAQLTAQAINVINHPQFTAPNTTPTSTAFGQVTSEFAWQRIVEFTLKLQF